MRFSFLVGMAAASSTEDKPFSLADFLKQQEVKPGNPPPKAKPILAKVAEVTEVTEEDEEEEEPPFEFVPYVPRTLLRMDEIFGIPGDLPAEVTKGWNYKTEDGGSEYAFDDVQKKWGKLENGKWTRVDDSTDESRVQAKFEQDAKEAAEPKFDSTVQGEGLVKFVKRDDKWGSIDGKTNTWTEVADEADIEAAYNKYLVTHLPWEKRGDYIMFVKIPQGKLIKDIRTGRIYLTTPTGCFRFVDGEQKEKVADSKEEFLEFVEAEAEAASRLSSSRKASAVKQVAQRPPTSGRLQPVVRGSRSNPYDFAGFEEGDEEGEGVMEGGFGNWGESAKSRLQSRDFGMNFARKSNPFEEEDEDFLEEEEDDLDNLDLSASLASRTKTSSSLGKLTRTKGLPLNRQAIATEEARTKTSSSLGKLTGTNGLPLNRKAIATENAEDDDPHTIGISTKPVGPSLKGSRGPPQSRTESYGPPYPPHQNDPPHSQSQRFMAQQMSYPMGQPMGYPTMGYASGHGSYGGQFEDPYGGQPSMFGPYGGRPWNVGQMDPRSMRSQQMENVPRKTNSPVETKKKSTVSSRAILKVVKSPAASKVDKVTVETPPQEKTFTRNVEGVDGSVKFVFRDDKWGYMKGDDWTEVPTEKQEGCEAAYKQAHPDL